MIEERAGAGARQALHDVEVVPMRRRHLRGVLAIEEVVYPRPWSAGLFTAELAQPDTRRYVVALSGASREASTLTRFARREVVGYAGLMLVLDEAHVTTVAVHPQHHRRKIATHLLLRILGEAVRMGATAATLEVRAANRGAQRLYTGFGFAPVGIRPRYYSETGEDAVIMWAHDLQGRAFAERLAAQAARLHQPGGTSGAPDLEVPWVRGRVGLGG